MPVHSKIQIYTFTFGDNPLLTPQDDSPGQYVCIPKIWLTWEIWQNVHFSNSSASSSSVSNPVSKKP